MCVDVCKHVCVNVSVHASVCLSVCGCVCERACLCDGFWLEAAQVDTCCHCFQADLRERERDITDQGMFSCYFSPMQEVGC